MSEEIGFEAKLKHPYDEAIKMVTAALKTEGFGVLTHIDVRATLKEKLGVDFRPYSILGACNPALSHRSLSQDPLVGLMLPCNVTVEESSPGNAIVRIANPEMMMTVGDLQKNPVLVDVAKEARSRLESVLEKLIAI